MLRDLLKLRGLERLLLTLYSALLLCLFFYSFTQIDLSLTISRNEFLQGVVRGFQEIGYFQRGLSGNLYLTLVGLLFAFYLLFLWLAYKEKISKTLTWGLLIAATVILTFSYNAFSYDLFNYIFDAKIITQYHENPYEHKALDYPQDPMLSFMRWTHREYPYGPAWLLLTVPLSFIGMQFFLLTFFLFKLMIGLSFLGSMYYLGKIMQKIKPQREVWALLFFGLNPLVIIESLVSAHLDIVMLFFFLLAFYLLLQKQYVSAWISFIVSIAIKFVTGFLIPVFLAVQFLESKLIKPRWDFVIFVSIILMIIAAAIATNRTTFQPWYLLEVLLFTAMLGARYWAVIPGVIVSLFALFTYVPYLYQGNWDPPIPQMLSDVYFFSYCFSFFLVALYFVYRQILFAKKVSKQKKHR